MKKQKLSALLRFFGFSQNDLADYLLITPQSLSRKLKNSTKNMSLGDLIHMAEMTKTTLAFIDENGKPIITFDKDDLS